MRVILLDLLRTTAIVWMIIFHTAYDLKTFGFTNLEFNQGFWFYFPRVIAGLFLFCVGVSSYLTHSGRIDFSKLKNRSLNLGFWAIIISLVTFFLFPRQWIYFGTLHCIFLGSLLSAPLVNRPKLATFILISILVGQYALDYDIKWVSRFTDNQSMDFIPIYPWFWVILLGQLSSPLILRMNNGKWLNRFSWTSMLSKHSLKIYLLHQPLLFGVLWVVKFFLST